MKLNEKNIDSWLKSNLEGASSPVEEALLETILIQNKTNNRKRLLVFWVNILMIAAWLVFYVNYRTNSVISENKEVVNERVQSDERETKVSGKNEELAKTLNSNGSSNTLDQSIKTGINERPLALINA
jgi:cell division protein FtsL